jgi:hypothetical protein
MVYIYEELSSGLTATSRPRRHDINITLRRRLQPDIVWNKYGRAP